MVPATGDSFDSYLVVQRCNCKCMLMGRCRVLLNLVNAHTLPAQVMVLPHGHDKGAGNGDEAPRDEM